MKYSDDTRSQMKHILNLADDRIILTGQALTDAKALTKEKRDQSNILIELDKQGNKIYYIPRISAPTDDDVDAEYSMQLFNYVSSIAKNLKWLKNFVLVMFIASIVVAFIFLIATMAR